MKFDTLTSCDIANLSLGSSGVVHAKFRAVRLIVSDEPSFSPLTNRQPARRMAEIRVESVRSLAKDSDR